MNGNTQTRLQGLEFLYHPVNRHQRQETWHETNNPGGHWRKYDLEQILARDKTSLEIIDNIEAGRASFREVLAGLAR